MHGLKQNISFRSCYLHYLIIISLELETACLMGAYISLSIIQ